MTEELKQAAQAGEREAFEATMRAKLGWDDLMLTQDEDCYYDSRADLALEVWRLARASLPTQPAAQATPAQEVVDERLWDLFIRLETVAFGDFKAKVRAAFDLEPTEWDDKRAAFTEWLQTTWPMIYPKGCADDLWRNGHLATLALAWQAHLARQFQIARQSPQPAAQEMPEPVGEPTTEQQTLTEIAKRLEASGLIHELSLPSETSRELSWTPTRLRGYYVDFIFDEDGKVSETSIAC